eukprot:1177841-Prorocentrum_minimum.AAC.3
MATLAYQMYDSGAAVRFSKGSNDGAGVAGFPQSSWRFSLKRVCFARLFEAGRRARCLPSTSSTRPSSLNLPEMNARLASLPAKPV